MEYGNGKGKGKGMVALLAVHAANQYYRLQWKPPVTAALLIGNTLLYLRPSFLHPFLPPLHHVCFNPHLILKNRDLKRLLMSPLYHMGESHLVYNMVSLLWKGIQLETAMGSVEFGSMVAALLVMSQGITLVLAKSLLVLFDYERAYYYEYSVGFSGVLFGLKVVLNSRSQNEEEYVHGIRVPARHAAWVELILIQMFVPGVSFLGHLGGILSGILYLKLKGGGGGSDPLTTLVSGIAGLLSWPMKFVGGLFRLRQHRRISGRGTAGGSRRGLSSSAHWRCQGCTFDNTGWLTVCEMCGTARNGSRPLSTQSGELSLDELRRRRIERYGR